MFTIDDVEKNYELGNQTRRVIDKNNKCDLFEFINGDGICVYVNYKNKNSLIYYYDVAFSNYWKRGVQKEMQAKKMQTSPLKIQLEMIKSLDALNFISDSILQSQGNGINLKAALKNHDLSNMPYADMFLETFSKEPYRFEILFNAIRENQYLNYELAEVKSKNGSIQYTVRECGNYENNIPQHGEWDNVQESSLNK